MLLAVAALAVIQSEEGLGGTEVMLSGGLLSSEEEGGRETSSTLSTVEQKVQYDDMGYSAM